MLWRIFSVWNRSTELIMYITRLEVVDSQSCFYFFDGLSIVHTIFWKHHALDPDAESTILSDIPTATQQRNYTTPVQTAYGGVRALPVATFPFTGPAIVPIAVPLLPPGPQMIESMSAYGELSSSKPDRGDGRKKLDASKSNGVKTSPNALGVSCCCCCVKGAS